MLEMEPVTDTLIESLYGRHAGPDVLGELEDEHKQEIQRETTLRAPEPVQTGEWLSLEKLYRHQA